MPLLLALVLAAAQAPDTVDVLFVRGTVYDGTGTPGRVADVAVRGDRILFVGDAAEGRFVPRRRVDARGLVVAPGFIDPHTHAFEGLPDISEERRRNTGALLQGVTTVVLGADGRGPLDVARVLGEAERLGIGTNAYVMAGFGTARGRVLGSSSAPATPAQIDSMRALIAGAMREGAFGVGSGLFYAPQFYSSTEEVIAVVKGASPYGGVYDTHQRDESSYSIGLLSSTREAIRIGRETGLTTNLGHVKALGVDVWGYADSVLALMRAARAEGHKVFADQYPYTASGTSLGALLPRWAQAGGRDSLLARISDPVTRQALLVEMRDNLRRRGGDSTLLFVSRAPAARPYLGKTLKQVARERGLPPVETAMDLIRTVGEIGVVSFNMNERDIETFMKDPFVMTSSDGSGGHPRLYGTYPRKIRRYVLDKPVITMERMIRSASGQVAEVYGMPERGLLRPGWFADVIAFDPRTIRDEATYTEPERLATGVRWVLVNGRVAVEEGRPTGVLAGRGLRKPVRRAAVQEGPDSGAFIVRLGVDTVSIERYVRQGARLEATSVIRTPRTVVRRLTLVLAPDGSVATMGVATGDQPIVPSAPAIAGAMPLPGGFWLPWDLVLRRARAADRDTVVVDVLAGGPGARPTPVRRTGPDSYTLPNQFDQVMHARLDERGRLLSLEVQGGGNTVQRIPWADVDALAKVFAARDSSGTGLGPLSPRHTVAAGPSGSRILVEYGRPALRGRPLEVLVPDGVVWRAGANDATTISSPRPLIFDNYTLDPGRYSMYLLPERDRWILIINRQTGMNALTRDPARDLARIPLDTRDGAPYTDRFTIDVTATAGGGTLVFRWGTREATARFGIGN